jgi:uncharacterized membrane protein
MAKKTAKKAAPKAAGKSDESKTYAIIAYITWIGWVIALILNMEKKHDLARFHIRQSLIIFLAALLTAIPFIGWIWGIVVLVFWIMGLISAINGEKKEIPIIGKYGQEWFKGL